MNRFYLASRTTDLDHSVVETLQDNIRTFPICLEFGTATFPPAGIVKPDFFIRLKSQGLYAEVIPVFVDGGGEIC